MKKFLLYLFSAILLVILGFFIFVSASWDKDHEAPYPSISASTDTLLIERGRYLAFGPAHCSHCHVPMEKLMEVDNGLQIPLSGGWELAIPPGTFHAPNLTPDEETGIGRLSDNEIARAMRYSISHRNKFMLPFMPFQNMSDEDIKAILSFLRSQEPVKHEIPENSYSFLGKAILAMGVIKPESPTGTPPKTVRPDTTAAYGSYIANSVANCRGCHTARDLKTGAFIGEPYAGGMVFGPDASTQGKVLISPNLTPDPETGIMAHWSEEAFVHRFRSGRIHQESPMPWGAFARSDEEELKAVYRYISGLEPVHNKIEKTIYEEGEELPD